MSQKTSAVGVKSGGCGCGSIGWSDATGCGCECATCAPLKAADRTRFFGGQRLSAEDLVSEQDYVLLKNRLHNRFLHGWGVVCGLEIGCGECPGEVKVLSGYALDPCGNDIVVPCVQRFDVLKAVQQCRDAARRKRPDCDPYQPPPNVDCDDATEHWCITLRYDEQPYKPSTALRQYANGGCGCGSSGHSASGCGCGGSSGGGGCACGGTSNGNGNGNGNGCGCGGTATKPSTTVLGVCEPSRVREGFKLGVVQDCGEECPPPEDALRKTFIGRVLCCLNVIRDLFGSELSKTERDLIAFHVFDGDLNLGELSATDVYEAVCRLRQKVRNVLEDERLPKHCTRLRELDQIVIPKPGADEVLDVYVGKVGNHFRSLVALVVDHVRDCVCDAFLPPCPEDPCDDRIILGCVDIRDGELIEVCAVSKRRYAGSFPALSYWLSVGPAIGWLLCRICCDPRLSQSKGERLRLMALFDQLDPSGELRRSVAAEDFSLVRRRYSDAQSFVKRLKPKNLSHTAAELVERLLGELMTAERVHYYERQYLSAIDFEAEQDYHRDARRRHNLAHHTWGIVVGLELVEREEGGSLAVYILPGMAVDGYGREVVLTAPYKLENASFDRFNTLAHRQVWIAYDEVEALPPAFGFGVCDTDDALRRTVESFRIVIDPTGATHDDVIVDGAPVGLPPSPPVPGKLYLPPDESAPYQELPDDAAPRWLIRLGTVQWDGPNLQFVAAADGRLNEQRRYVGVVAADLYAPTPELRIRSRLSPVESKALEFAKIEGPLRVTGRTVAEQDVYVDGGKVRLNYLAGDTDSVDLFLQRQRGPADVGHRLRIRLGDDPSDVTTMLSIGPAVGVDEKIVLGVRADDVVDVPTGTLRFRHQTRQMIDLWDSADKPGKAPYGLGVQSGTLYQRTGNQYCWFRGGEHADAASAPGDGGFLQMLLDDVGRLHLIGDGTDKQAINLINPNAGIGTQPNVLYERSPGGFAWYRGGSHSTTAYDAGGGTRTMLLDGSGNLVTAGDVQVGGRLSVNDILLAAGDVSVGFPGAPSNLQVTGDLRLLGDDDSAFRVREYPLARKNADPPWSVSLVADFTKVYTAFVVMQGFSIFDNSGDLNFGHFDRLQDLGAIVQHCWVRITYKDDAVVQGETFCSESALFEDDNTVLFTVVVFGRKR